MSDINLVKPHSLPIAKARALAQKAAEGLADEHNLSSEWHGNTLHFHRSGVNGQMDVTDKEIRLHITLGFLLKPFRGTLLGHIEDTFRNLLGERAAGVRARKPVQKSAHPAG
jgi:putative polyhydroxyalkanoate system protein